MTLQQLAPDKRLLSLLRGLHDDSAGEGTTAPERDLHFDPQCGSHCEPFSLISSTEIAIDSWSPSEDKMMNDATTPLKPGEPDDAASANGRRGRKIPARRNVHPPVQDIRGLLTFKLARMVAANDRAGQDWTMHRFGLRLNEFRVLSLTVALQPLLFGDAARYLFMDRGQMSRLVKSLAEMGLISTTPASEDQRSIHLVPTSAGLRKHEAMIEFAFARNGVTLGRMTKAEVRQLIGLLDKLMISVEASLDVPL